MTELIDQVQADLACPQCGRVEKKPVSWLLENKSHICPMCAEETDLTSPEWKAKIQTYVDACAGFSD